MAEEHMVRFTYERLASFCYLRGMLGHLAKFCEEQFKEGFMDSGEHPPYGPWLCEPIPSRSRVLQRSITRTLEGSRLMAAQPRDSKKGQAIFCEFGLRSGSITPLRLKIPMHNLATGDEATSKDPEDEQTLVKEMTLNIPNTQWDRDNEMRENMILDSILSSEASSGANRGRLARLD
ncbi:UNVERIFIED_CONTAM: hypothetical protein Sradi_3610700 [Sesamum radiatum]|uniref:Zinc knuckle CX2CX4HX4C domain-containing protein n=1 Tax=Sesamum radiatum TaxID=300843 RepID=A0AAW2QH43_SESRA